MATLAPEAPKFTHWNQVQPKDALAHIPGEDGWPILGNTLQLLADPSGFGNRMRAKYGDIYRNNSFGRRGVVMFGAEAISITTAPIAGHCQLPSSQGRCGTIPTRSTAAFRLALTNGAGRKCCSIRRSSN